VEHQCPGGNYPAKTRAYLFVLTGLIAVVAALAVATALGFAWRARNGKMRDVRGASAAAAVAVSAPGADRAAGSGDTGDTRGARVSAGDLGESLGSRATLLQFSSAFCAPCRATRRVLAEVAGMTDGVAHIEVDAESRLDLVRRLDVLKTPTVFVLGPDGRIAKRASGQPRKADVIAAIGNVT
jgi:thiol-disulfide isomerase/thioredoxin